MAKNQESFWRSIWKHGLNSPYIEKFLGKQSDIGNWWKGATGSGLTNAQIEANDFSAEEAEKQRAWEEQMDNTKVQRQTEDMKAAGLNPAMMYGTSMGVSSAPSGSAASSVDAGSPSGGLLSSIMDIIFAKQRLANLKAEEKNIESQTDKNYADADYSRSNKQLADSSVAINRLIADYYPQVTEGNLKLLESQVAEIWSKKNVNDSMVFNVDADTALKKAQKSVKELEKEWYPRLSEAKEKADLGASAAAYARAAYDNFVTSFTMEHDGQMPGYNMWLGLGAAIEGALKDLGFKSLSFGKDSGQGGTTSFADWFANSLVAKGIDKFFEMIANAPD